MTESFEAMLSGGHPNSLGRTVEVTELVLADTSGAKLKELFGCYKSKDEVVRLRTSNALKRITKERPELIRPYLPKFLSQITKLDQASAQWTLADIFGMMGDSMTAKQLGKAKAHLLTNLQSHDDWIVLNQTIKTLLMWAKGKKSIPADPELAAAMLPELRRLSKDSRKSVAKTASKALDALQSGRAK